MKKCIFFIEMIFIIQNIYFTLLKTQDNYFIFSNL